MPKSMRPKFFAIAVIAGATMLAGCNSIRDHRGFINDPLLSSSIQPGLDNQVSVERTLGRPTFTSQFGDPVWYYVSSNTAEKPFNTPKITKHSVLAVQFDQAGNVRTINRSGIDDVVRLKPDSDSTPTLGRERGFFQDLFGNIGQVGGAVGASN